MVIFAFFTAKICPYYYYPYPGFEQRFEARFDGGRRAQPGPGGLPGAPRPMPTLMPAPSIPGKYKMRIYYR